MQVILHHYCRCVEKLKVDACHRNTILINIHFMENFRVTRVSFFAVVTIPTDQPVQLIKKNELLRFRSFANSVASSSGSFK